MNKNKDIENFLTIYNLILERLNNKNNKFIISIYYINNEFNINIKTINEEIIYNEHFIVSPLEYNYLLTNIGFSFIENHEISLPFFTDLSGNDFKIYYLNNNSDKKPLDYDLAKVHVLRNTKFELKIYYFNGLNDLSFNMHDKAKQYLII